MKKFSKNQIIKKKKHMNPRFQFLKFEILKIY